VGRERVVIEDDCKHPYVALTWVWGNVYHCWDCGELIGEDDDTEED
jgi:hypothetical protein